MQRKFGIRGLGFYAPETVLTNADLEKLVDTSDEWVKSRTGIAERRIVSEGQGCSDLAFEAAQMALDDAGMEPSELTHILVGTFTPDHYIPSCACMLQHKLGITGCMAMDLGAACSGFLYSLETARGIVALHPEAKVLVVGSEVVTSRINFTDRTTCVLFGDAAGAVVLTAADDNCFALVEDVILRADGSQNGLLTVTGGASLHPPKLHGQVDESYFVRMNGREVFKHAVRNMDAATRELLARNDLVSKDIDVFIPHQANMRIIEALAKRMDYPREKIYVNLERYGNTSAASIPVALAEARIEGFIPSPSTVVLTSFGGGLTWASALLRFV
ncbi:MAG: beta-ketoacyl-ACP synthase III [Desulfovibrionales bacterium]